MSRLREQHRKDANHTELVATARMLGIQIEQFPPLDVWACIRGKWWPVEIKTPDRKGKKNEFTDEQMLFFNRCDSFGHEWLVWYTTDDILASLR